MGMCRPPMQLVQRGHVHIDMSLEIQSHYLRLSEMVPLPALGQDLFRQKQSQPWAPMAAARHRQLCWPPDRTRGRRSRQPVLRPTSPPAGGVVAGTTEGRRSPRRSHRNKSTSLADVPAGEASATKWFAPSVGLAWSTPPWRSAGADPVCALAVAASPACAPARCP